MFGRPASGAAGDVLINFCLDVRFSPWLAVSPTGPPAQPTRCPSTFELHFTTWARGLELRLQSRRCAIGLSPSLEAARRLQRASALLDPSSFSSPSAARSKHMQTSRCLSASSAFMPAGLVLMFASTIARPRPSSIASPRASLASSRACVGLSTFLARHRQPWFYLGLARRILTSIQDCLRPVVQPRLAKPFPST